MADRNYGAIRSAVQFQAFAERIIKANKRFGLDIESGYHGPDRQDTSLQMFHPEWVFGGFSFTNSTEWARYVPIGHDNGDNVDDPKLVAKWLWKMLRTGLAIAHNAPFELKGTRRWFLEMLSDDPEVGQEVIEADGLWPIFSDTQIECFLSAKYHPLTVGQDLKSLTLHVFGHQMIKFAELFPLTKSGKTASTKRQRFNTLELTPQVITYACEDALWCLALHEHPDHYAALKDQIVYKTEIALIPILVAMEIEALALDWAEIDRRADECQILAQKMDEEIQQELSDRLGEVVNINLGSTKQLSDVLFDKLGLPATLKTDSGAPSTSEKALGNIAKADPVIRQILDLRQVQKLYGSYLNKYRTELRYAPDDRAHANHKQTGAGTGRMSVDGVSYQQWPKPYHYELKDGTTFDLNFRNLLISPEGYRIIGFDYSQVELRVLAGQAGETALLKAFADGIDIHKATASNMMGIPLEEVTKKIRAKGKAQPLDAKILTPFGWVRMGDLQPGDAVIGSGGEAVKVEAVYPQGKKKIYRVTTSDGGVTECCDEHLWTVRNHNTKNAPWRTRTLRELMDSGLRQGTQPKYELPARPVVQYDPQGDLPIDPYFLGLLLGDGGFRHDWAAYYCTADEQLAEYARNAAVAMGVGVREEKRPDGLMKFFFPSLVKNGPNPLTRALKDLGLWGVHGSDKFIPDIYLRATPEERLAVLQGVMDTDGNPLYSAGQLRMTAPEMILGIQEIARSLGGNATYSVKKTPDRVGSFGKNRKDTHITQVLLPAGTVPFRLARKIEKLRERKYKAAQRILSVEYVGEKEAQCIRVSSDDSLYLTDSFIPTHNTLNFAVVYGSGAENIASMLTSPDDPVTKEDAVELLEKYFAAFPELKKWMDARVVEGREQGFVTNMFGRKFTVWEYQDHREWIRNKGDRLCVNAPIQGGAADYCKIAMVRADKAIKKAEAEGKIPKGSVRMVMMVHDALEWYVRNDVDTQTVIDILGPAVSYRVPGLPEIKADWHEAKRWGEPVEVIRNAEGTITGYGIEDVETTFATVQEAYNYYVSQSQVEESVNEAMEHLTEEKIPEAEVQPTFSAVTISDMPDENQWALFQQFLAKRSGLGTMMLVTPEGSVEFDKVHLTPDDQPTISALLGGAHLTFQTDEWAGVDLEGVDL